MLGNKSIGQESARGRGSVPNSSDGPIFEKRRAKDGLFLTKIRALDGRKDGRRRAKFKFLFLKKRVNSNRDSSLGYTG